MRGYKVFDSDWTCRGFHYKVGETYEMDEEPVLCERGFHFCEKLVNCWNYRNWTGKEKIAEVETLGEVVSDGEKFVTNKIKIIREISVEEITSICNVGYGNTGVGNSGCCNTGNFNKGSYNSGHYNNGDYNKGIYNSADWNNGNWNTGFGNTGDSNSGNFNQGNRNSGYWNTGNWNSGCFCEVQNPTIKFFDKPSDWTITDWYWSIQNEILSTAPIPVGWIPYKKMSVIEREIHPEYKTTFGYLREYNKAEQQKRVQLWWDDLSSEDKTCIRQLPNFDPEKFSRIMGGIDLGGIYEN